MQLIEVNSKLYHFDSFFMDESTADVTFECGPENETPVNVPAHRLVLAACSPVFKTMFYGSLPEKSQIRLTDTTADGFKEFLQFFYLNRVKLTIENAPEVINLVKKYELNDILDLCSKFICRELAIDPRIDQLCEGFELAMRFDLPQLKLYCDTEFANNPVEFLESESFLECSPTILKMILQKDELKCYVDLLFRQCLKWARNAWKQRENSDKEPTLPQLREQLDDYIDLIEFSSMDIEEITTLFEEFGNFFSEKDLIGINRILSAKYAIPQFQEKELRCCLFKEKNLRFDGFVPKECTAAEQVMVFQSSTTVFLVGYDCLRIFKNWLTEPLPIWLTIVRKSANVDSDTGKNSDTEKESDAGKERDKDVILFRDKLSCTEYSKFDYVMTERLDSLSVPIAIEPNIKYEIRVKIPSFGDGVFYTTDIEDFSNEFTFGNNDTEKITIKQHGLIAALYFKTLGVEEDNSIE